ncbi:large terminase [Sanguibacter massiliensis]|uniref:large terminase n=1 Tax=Sanguibacter massiliensis TaxID=1973217 RepID=UPI000C86731D|nr:large terminase [Sanguibacter massiliensis]
MGLLVVPGADAEPWPTIGGDVCDFIEERAVYGPGSLQGQPYVIDPEFRAFIYRLFEVYPQGHPWAGRRRFKRGGLSVRKGLAKTEKEALLVYAHIHPEGPGKCDGFDADGHPVAAPVMSPYVPMLAFSLDQVEELAYGALKYVIENGPDSDLFDVSLERALRLDDWGRADGGAWPLANAPDSRDGGRTTLNAFDEPHRLHLPRHLKAHETMAANLAKRPLEDPWSLYVGTAGELGQGSVAENLHAEAEAIRDGKIERPDLFYLYRTDDGGHDLEVKAERIKAVAEATGPAGEWGPGQFDDIASQWDRLGVDKAYLERVWLNRWVKSGQQAFDVKRWSDLKHEGGDVDKPLRGRIPAGAPVAVGFDGARRRDSTAFVITDLLTGTQEIAGLWEKDLDDDEWEVPEAEVDQTVEHIFSRYNVWRLYGDPPYWVTEMGVWAGRHKGLVEEWWTNHYKKAAYAIRAYQEAIASGAVGWTASDPHAPELARHIAAAGQVKLKNIVDDEGKPLYILGKIHPDRKFDAAMAAMLSWQAYLDGVKAGQAKPHVPARPRRIR